LGLALKDATVNLQNPVAAASAASSLIPVDDLALVTKKLNRPKEIKQVNLTSGLNFLVMILWWYAKHFAIDRS
jgi:hypothetical protein